MMQGDSYRLRVALTDNKNAVVTPADITDVEITIGYLKKTYANNEVTYDGGLERWLFPLTQTETFKYPPTKVKAQVRVVWNDGRVEGASLGYVNVLESISKEVL